MWMVEDVEGVSGAFGPMGGGSAGWTEVGGAAGAGGPVVESAGESESAAPEEDGAAPASGRVIGWGSGPAVGDGTGRVASAGLSGGGAEEARALIRAASSASGLEEAWKARVGSEAGWVEK